MLVDLSPAATSQGDLFTAADSELSRRLMAAVDRMNRDMGRGTVIFAGQGIQQRWRMQANMKSPSYTTSWQDLRCVRGECTMDELPAHGRVSCTRCYEGCSRVDFDSTKRTEGTWRITANPLSWGAIEPEIIVLGFSKGPTQAGALASSPHNDIPYKGSRKNVGKILAHVGLLPLREGDDPGEAVSRLIADTKGRFHFGSLIRCTVEQYFKDDWRGSGGGMLDKFLAAPFGREVASNCVARFLKNLPARTKLVVLFGMGTKLNYVRASHQLVSAARGGTWRWINDVAYTDGKVTVVHVEHFASQGALIPQWLGEGGHARANYGRLAAAAIASVIAADSNSRPAP